MQVRKVPDLRPPSTRVSPPKSAGLLTRIRLCLALLMAGLLFSSLPGFFPLNGTKWILGLLARTSHFGDGTPLFTWFLGTRQALMATSLTARFLFYATNRDGLSRILFALLFLGPYRDPVRNRWVINFGLLSCAALVLFAFVAGEIQGMPFLWRCADAAFALLCALPLLLCKHYIHLFEHITVSTRRQRSERIRRLRRA